MVTSISHLVCGWPVCCWRYGWEEGRGEEGGGQGCPSRGRRRSSSRWSQEEKEEEEGCQVNNFHYFSILSTPTRPIPPQQAPGIDVSTRWFLCRNQQGHNCEFMNYICFCNRKISATPINNSIHSADRPCPIPTAYLFLGMCLHFIPLHCTFASYFNLWGIPESIWHNLVHEIYEPRFE